MGRRVRGLRPRALAAAADARPTVGRRGAAEDAVQTVLLRLYRRWPRLTDDPYAYARSAVAHACIDTHRRTWRFVSSDSPHDSVESDATGGVLDRSLVRDAVAQLPPNERAVVVLGYLEDLSVAEVASALGVPEGTVKSTAHRALGKLRASLSEPKSLDVEAHS